MWQFSLLVSLSALGLSIWQIGFGILPVAQSADNSFAKINSVSADSLLRDSDQFEVLFSELEETQTDIASASQFVIWSGRLSGSVAWMPPLSHEIRELGRQAERVLKDLAVSETLFDASYRLVSIYDQTQAALTTSEANEESLSDLKAEIIGLQSAFVESSDLLSVQPPSNTRESILINTTKGRNLAEQLVNLESQMLEASVIGKEVSSLLIELIEIADGVQPIMGLLANDAPDEPITTENLSVAIEKINAHSSIAKQKALELEETLANSEQGDQLLPQLAMLDTALDTLIALGNAASVVNDIITPAMSSSESSQDGLLSDGSSLIAIFDSVNENREEVYEATQQLKEAESNIASLGENEEVANQLGQIPKLIGELRTGLELLMAVSPVASEVLGANDERRYLVLGQSADELRGTGGFVSSVWLVTFENGSMTDVQYFDAVRVDDWDNLPLYPVGPTGLDEHMDAWVWLMRDVSWDPDFPTTAQAAQDLFRLGQRQEVDGVIAINQWTLLSLMEALGSVPSPQGGDPITTGNLIANLEQGTDQHGRAYMDLVLQGVLGELNRPNSLASLVRLASAMNGSLRNRELLIYFNDEQAQSTFQSLGWGGEIKDSSGDYLFVVDSNIGWSKVDRNIQREIRYLVDLSRSPSPRATLTLGYINHSGPNSTGCEPQWLNRGTNYNQLKNACYWNLFRAYMPQGSRVLSSPTLPLPQYSVAVDTEKALPGQNTSQVTSVHNKIMVSGLATLQAGQSQELSTVYDLPDSTVRQESSRLIYELLVQKQSGVRNRELNIELIPPEGYQLASSSISPIAASESRVKYSLDLTRDVTLAVEFDKY